MAFKVLFAFVCLAVAVNATYKECKPTQFNYDSVVCVCDEDYCDSSDPLPPSEGEYLIVTSNKDGLRFAPTYGDLTEPADCDINGYCLSFLTRNAASFEVRKNETAQTMLGFGGAFTDTVGINLNNLTAGLVDVIFKSYFTKEGLSYNMARTPIGYTDFSESAYFYTNVENDWNMTSWALREEDYNLRIPYIKKALSMVDDDLLLTANVWTVPAWLREADDAGILSKVTEERWGSYCLYIVKYLEALREEGIDFWSVGYGNEPIVTMGIDFFPDQDPLLTVWALNKLGEYAVKVFAPALKERGFNNTKILFFDDSRDIISQLNMITFFQTEGISEVLELMGIHSYKNDYVSANLVDMVHDMQPNVTVVTTELCTGFGEPYLGAWSTAEYYAQIFVEEMNHLSSGWIDWNLVLNMAGGPRLSGTGIDAPIIVDHDNNVFYKQPSYYAIGQFSKFIPRGSKKVSIVSEYPTDVQSTAALRPDGLVAAILFNKSNSTVAVSLKEDKRQIQVELTPNSVNTILF